jgi:hypothetical protein
MGTIVNGRYKTWNDSGVDVKEGEVINILAEDTFIFFYRGMWGRNPNGIDKNGGGIEEPAHAYDGVLGPHMAPLLRKNSLVCRIGEHGEPFQGGTNIVTRANGTGRLYFAANDNGDFKDNIGTWNVTVIRKAAIKEKGKARIYCRPSGAAVGPLHSGHVGWAFTINADGEPPLWMVGGTEDLDADPNASAAAKNCWSMITKDPDLNMTAPDFPLTASQQQKVKEKGMPAWELYKSRYDIYKEIEVERPQVDLARQQFEFTSRLPYDLFRRNCMHDTFAILSAYGVRFGMAPGSGMEYMFPSIWFYKNFPQNNIMAIGQPVDKTVDLSIYWDRNMGYDRFDIYQSATWKLGYWSCQISSLVLRKGYLRLFKGNDCTGQHIDLAAPFAVYDASRIVVNGTSFDFNESVKSLITSDRPFDKATGRWDVCEIPSAEKDASDESPESI